MKSRWQFAAACLAGIAVSVLFYGSALGLTARGVNDFISLYAGARLAGTANLYDTERNIGVQNAAAGWSSSNMLFCRLPYYATLLWPLGQLPYATAYRIWEALSLLTMIAFALLWPIPDRKTTILACCWSVPVFTVLAGGQDVGYLLLWVALVVRLMRSGRVFAAGFVLALCAAKFHLFLMVPIWIAAQRRWRLGVGLLSGGAMLLAFSFATGGIDWPERYARFLLDPKTNPNLADMPNLHAMLAGVASAGWLEMLGAVSVAAGVWTAARNADFDYGLAVMLAGGLLTGRHTYLADCALLVPAGLIVYTQTRLPWQRAVTLFLLSPAWSLFLVLGQAAVSRVALLLFTGGLAWEAAFRHKQASRPVPGPAGLLR